MTILAAAPALSRHDLIVVVSAMVSDRTDLTADDFMALRQEIDLKRQEKASRL